MTQQRQAVELELAPLAALAGALSAAAEAGRYAGGGMRTVGRRFAGTGLSRRAVAAARESRRRTDLAFQIMRGLELPVPPPEPRTRPAFYVAVGILTGTTAAVLAEALRRAVANGSLGGRWMVPTPVPAGAPAPPADSGSPTEPEGVARSF